MPQLYQTPTGLNKENRNFTSFTYFCNDNNWFQDYSFAIKRLVISVLSCLHKAAWTQFSLLLCPSRSLLICSAAHNSPPQQSRTLLASSKAYKVSLTWQCNAQLLGKAVPNTLCVLHNPQDFS